MISVLTPTIRPKGLDAVQESLEAQEYQDFEWLVEVGLPSKGCDLNAAMNRMLRRAKGDIIVSWQDWITCPPATLGRIAEFHRMSEMTAFTYPVAKYDFNFEAGRFDWRQNTNGPIPYHQWETDLASAPKQMFLDIGGYDEEFDKGWSWDNVNVGHRARMAGYHFRCCPIVFGRAWDHDKTVPHPFRGKTENGDLSALKSVDIAKGEWKLKYL